MTARVFVPRSIDSLGDESPWELVDVKGKKSIPLDDEDATLGGHSLEKDELRDALSREQERIGELQRVFYADGRNAILIVLQGRDASGKDGVIRKVFSAVNPMGCEVSSFKRPSELEARHDFLWRIHAKVPERGMIGIFNRSHYEDVLVPRVHKTLPKRVWSARYEQINAFEDLLSLNGTLVLKFMLHISRDEQKKRLEERLSDATKNWKFNEGDLADRAKWDAFTKAYRGIIENTSTKRAPWHVVPADDNGVRDLLVARAVGDAMESLDLRYPKADASVLALEIE